MAKINLKFPFKNTIEGGVFGANITTEQAVKSNLLALLTLKKGQRPMDNNLYSPLYDYVMEPMDEITRGEIKERVEEKVSAYIPEIEIKEIIVDFDEENNLIKVKIKYTIPYLSMSSLNSVDVSVVQEV